MNNKIPVILDGDPGHDDAIGWVIAKASKDLDILAITAVNGNCSVDKAALNAQKICSLIDLNVPIAKGDYKPLYIDSLKAPVNIHGESGLDGPTLPEPKRELENKSAVSLMIEILENSKEKVTIVATGPLTNVASLLLTRPDLKEKIERISIMGGGIKHGNWSAAAEFNILIDPHAADIVFKCGLPIVMAGLDVTEKALVKPKDIDRISNLNNHVSDIVAKWLKFFYQFHQSIGYEGAPLHDPCAIMYLIHPEIFTTKELFVQIETNGHYTTGQTVADYYNITGNIPNATCLMDLDLDRFIDYLVDYIKEYGD